MSWSRIERVELKLVDELHGKMKVSLDELCLRRMVFVIECLVYAEQ